MSYLKLCLASLLVYFFATPFTSQNAIAQHDHHHKEKIEFSIRSTKSGDWSDANCWEPKRLPKSGDRVLVSRGTRIKYDLVSPEVIRLLQVVGRLEFSRSQNTELNVGVLKVQDSDTCTESGFACDFAHVNPKGEPNQAAQRQLPALIVGTRENPIPANVSARIRLHFLEGMDKQDAPAVACCSAQMEIHGSPLERTWVKLAANSQTGSDRIVVKKVPRGWKAGDNVIVTASNRTQSGYGSFRPHADGKQPETEQRRIKSISGNTIQLDQPLKYFHAGEGEFRAEIANLSRNVVVESADPQGVRGHTVFHRFSRGGISFAKFAHLGKEGVLGRYAIHYHLVGHTMRGSCVEGVSIVDSHNRWVTIHGTQFLVVRDCVGYQSVGHGYFLEDATEVFNLLDRNLAVHAYTGKRIPNQALPFDPNDGAGFWWANGLNTLTRNVTVENDEYGYRYDIQKRSNFDPVLPILQPDGSEQDRDVRTLPIWRFDHNEARAEGFYGMVVAANGNDQPDSGIRTQRMLDRIKRIDWTAPDTKHPHIIRNLKIGGAHYAFRPHSPAMLMEGIRIHSAVYGIYRPCFENQVYKDLHLSQLGPEPFNRGMDDASAQVGSISVDGLKLDNLHGGNQRHPFIHMTDNALSENAECHFRNIEIGETEGRRPLFNLGGSQLVDPFVSTGVPYYVHDFYGPRRDAKIVSIKAKDLIHDGNRYVEQRPVTGDESRIAEVKNVPWPELLTPVDDLPPVTVITDIMQQKQQLVIKGITHDNGEIRSVIVNGHQAELKHSTPGVVDWLIKIDKPKTKRVQAYSRDQAGNVEKMIHELRID